MLSGATKLSAVNSNSTFRWSGRKRRSTPGARRSATLPAFCAPANRGSKTATGRPSINTRSTSTVGAAGLAGMFPV